ncbi:MAG: hypothetical protein ABR567_18705 [Myxococcales bacterium]|nr:hypothetical protein [Myxococcales bacterium]
MARKIILVVAAILVPGGFIALIGAWLVKALSQTERGRKVVDLARSRVPAWVAGWRVAPPQRQAA